MRDTIKILLIVLAVLTFSSPVSCSASSSSEAEKEANKYWDSVGIKCGDSYYLYERRDRGHGDIQDFFTECKGKSIVTHYQNITEADKLNGIEGKAKSNLYCKATRMYRFGKWDPWSSPSDGWIGQLLAMTKMNGKWNIEHVARRPIRPTCENIPKG